MANVIRISRVFQIKRSLITYFAREIPCSLITEGEKPLNEK